MIEINNVVELKDGRKGRVVGQLQNGEYLLASGKGGKITYFRDEELLKRHIDYKCIHCGGTGELEVHGPSGTHTRTCTDCRGSGEKLIEIPLREYEELKKGKEKTSE